MLKPQSSKKETPLQEETNSATLVPIPKEALWLLIMQLSYLTSNDRLIMLPSWLDLLSNSICIGYDDSGLILRVNEFGTVRLLDFCWRLKQLASKTIASTTRQPTMELQASLEV